MYTFPLWLVTRTTDMLTAYNVYVGKYWDGRWFTAARDKAQPYNFSKYQPLNTVLVRIKTQ